MTSQSDTQAPVILYGFPKQPGVPSGSAFCQKLEAYFRFSGVTYTDAGTFPPKAPKGKLPYVKLQDGTILADSHFIIRHFIKEGLAEDLDSKAGLSDLQKAESVVWRGYWEDHVYPAITYTRWMIPNNFQQFLGEQLPNVPWLVKKLGGTMAHYNIASCLKGHGVGRHSLQEVEDLLKLSFSALETRLKSNTNNGKWFFGEKGPSEVDAAIYGVLATVAITPSTPLVRRLIADSPILMQYIVDITESYFPEYSELSKTMHDYLAKQ